MSRLESGSTLKAALASAERVGAGRAYPRALRARVAAYVIGRRDEAATDEAISRELGIAAMTFRRWAGGRRAAFAVASVVGVTSTAPSAASPLVVHGPRGLRIEGLDVEQIATLWSRLS